MKNSANNLMEEVNLVIPILGIGVARLIFSIQLLSLFCVIIETLFGC